MPACCVMCRSRVASPGYLNGSVGPAATELPVPGGPQLHHRHKPRIARDVKPARRTLEEFGCHVQNHTLKIEFGQ